ncbi:tetratricopeptide repeat protein [Thermoflavimicrobium dichotomicum]|uniref:Tetratricopeptide repeat-containing protein n=1 Tax=Thermoflavimicrobium dichotomicum TaxID=46223 RepID=A0A1I3QTC0_9BACL|nr:tetratricopeptide repeat protein [Thermoflavimicrobium dichotomicum]SFJ36356.1 Tetratricopeptide repeat-containing protein [Thermoflavimicrobium dichotomicum]
MQNYYELLNISPSATTEEIRQVLVRELRKWTQRTNSPHFEKRQEAERMVRKLEEIEAILLNEERRRAYDEQLKSASANISHSSLDVSAEYSSANIQQEIAQGWKLLKQGKSIDALLLVRKLVEQAPNHDETWALLAHARFQNGEKEEAIQAMVRACELNPQSEYFIFLGDIYRSFQRLDQAEKCYQQAAQLNLQDFSALYKLGTLYLELKQYQKAIEYLERCQQRNPHSPEVNRELARAYFEMATSDWVEIPSGNPYLPQGLYPVNQNLNLTKTEVYLQRASQLSFMDYELRGKLESAKRNLAHIKGRKFTGSWVWAIASVVMFWGIIWMNYFTANLDYTKQWDNVIAMFGYPILYIISAYSPRLRIFKEAAKRRSPRTDFAYLFDWLKERTGDWAYLLTLVIMALCFPVINFILPVVIVYNFYQNYIRSWSEKA